jgi:hypothetical protein
MSSAITRSRRGTPSRRASAADSVSLATICEAAENVTGEEVRAVATVEAVLVV